LQEHDPAQFIPQPRDYQAIDKLQIQHTPVALKYSGLAELVYLADLAAGGCD